MFLQSPTLGKEQVLSSSSEEKSMAYYASNLFEQLFHSYEQRFLLDFKYMILITMTAKCGGSAVNLWNKTTYAKIEIMSPIIILFLQSFTTVFFNMFLRVAKDLEFLT